MTLLIPAVTALPGPGRTSSWGRLVGASAALAVAELAARADHPVVVIADDAVET